MVEKIGEYIEKGVPYYLGGWFIVSMIVVVYNGFKLLTGG